MAFGLIKEVDMKRFLIICLCLLIPVALLAYGISYEDETSYTDMRGSFTDAAAWFDGEIVGAELIVDAEDRAFTTENGANWTNGDFDEYEENGTLHLHSNGAGQYCTLPDANAVMAIGTLYKITFTVASLGGSDSFTISDENANQTFGTVTANGAQKFYVAYTGASGGGIRITGVTAEDEAEFDNFSIKPITSLSAYAGTGNLLIIDDGTGKKAYGYIGEAGTGETLGAELIAWNNDPYIGLAYETFTLANPDITQAVNTVGGAYANDSVFTANQCFKVTKNITTAGGQVPRVYNEYFLDYGANFAVFDTTGDGAWELYFTAIATNLKIAIYSSAATDFSGTFSAKQVTEPNANAVKIYKDKGLTIPGWHEIQAGINYNAGASWDFDVYRTRGEATQ